jgi:hypothetical protein
MLLATSLPERRSNQPPDCTLSGQALCRGADTASYWPCGTSIGMTFHQIRYGKVLETIKSIWGSSVIAHFGRRLVRCDVSRARAGAHHTMLLGRGIGALISVLPRMPSRSKAAAAVLTMLVLASCSGDEQGGPFPTAQSGSPIAPTPSAGDLGQNLLSALVEGGLARCNEATPLLNNFGGSAYSCGPSEPKRGLFLYTYAEPGDLSAAVDSLVAGCQDPESNIHGPVEIVTDQASWLVLVSQPQAAKKVRLALSSWTPSFAAICRET